MSADLRQKLLYRRQYLYGPAFDDFPHWTRLSLPNGKLLAVHPDLEVTSLEEGAFRLVLLGYLLDPGAPENSNQQILSRISREAKNTTDLIAALDDLGGRYVLFIFTGSDQVVLNDAGGLRQVFYHNSPDGSLWLAPQPGLIADRFQFKYSTEVDSFLNSETIQKYREPWFPGDATPFAEVKHLLPNHLLDLKSGEVRRYWPLQRISKQGMQEGAKKAAGILQQLMQAANNRFNLAMALTGGYDSRIVFAACRGIVQELHVYSMMYHRLSEQSPDITLAQQIAGFAGVPHHLFSCFEPMDEDFSYLYTHNLEKIYQSYGNIVYGRFRNLDQDKVVVKSVVNEIARCFYYRNGVYPYRVTPEFLCKVSKLGEHPFVYRKFEEWMNDAQPVVALGYKLLDFFYWENRNANWQAMSQLEFDLAHEEFTPFSCRTLLATMLGVDHQYRCMPKNTFQREMVRQSWGELDQFPYNPRGKVIKKPFYEGPWMKIGRWIKYHLKRK